MIITVSPFLTCEPGATAWRSKVPATGDGTGVEFPDGTVTVAPVPAVAGVTALDDAPEAPNVTL